MRQRYKIGIVLVVVVLIAGFGIYKYIYQDHRDIASETAQEELSATAMLARFQEANEQVLLNTTVNVSGKVSEKDNNSVTLDNAVHCALIDNVNVEIGAVIVIKGRCIGYDDLFEIVKMDQCTIVTN